MTTNTNNKLTAAQMAVIRRMQAGDRLLFNSMKGNYYFQPAGDMTASRYPREACWKKGLSKLARVLLFTQS